jgi:hypothetical protein
MKEITSVTPTGIHYIDEEGNSQFIDFETCLQNYMMRWERPDITDEDRAFWQEAKYVGVRLSFREPRLIEFYTEPRIYFEFPTKDDFYEVLSMIKKAGWRTNDGE